LRPLLLPQVAKVSLPSSKPTCSLGDLYRVHLNNPQLHGLTVRQVVHRRLREVEPGGRLVNRQHCNGLPRCGEGQVEAAPAHCRIESRNGLSTTDVGECGQGTEGSEAETGDKAVLAGGAGDGRHGMGCVVVNIVEGKLVRDNDGAEGGEDGGE
jgi:hypothetical protein